jgi:hypothetical protein
MTFLLQRRNVYDSWHLILAAFDMKSAGFCALTTPLAVPK